jgi:hypothetical protein
MADLFKAVQKGTLGPVRSAVEADTEALENAQMKGGRRRTARKTRRRQTRRKT